MNISNYDYKKDGDKVFTLYKKTVGQKWPLGEEDFHKLINNHYKEGACLVYEVNNTITGFVVMQVRDNLSAAIVLYIFNEQSQNPELLQKAMEYLRERKVKKVQLGGGGYEYFWPGIPSDLPEIVNFFKDQGWNFTDTSVDLTQNLSAYKIPEGLEERIKTQGISFQIADDSQIEDILAFENEYFPDWARYYENKINVGETKDILLAMNLQNNIVGTVILSDKNSNSKGNFWMWRKMLGTDTGAFGAIGVKPDMRSKGIGLALAAKATKILEERGVKTCYIGWTWLIEWYGKLGFKGWREYQMSWKELDR